jgi:tetratricopeptide (TPR) repeat protein/predicted Ser/Thr protein kinase
LKYTRGTSTLHNRAKDLFLDALTRPEAERAKFLADVCRDDIGLRREVESLLALHRQEQSADSAGVAESDRDEGDELPFAPGDVFAGRYRMITRLGRGGMGDVWQADDLILGTPVALKLIRSARPSARMAILNEVRLARQITHPSVCRVFDVGEADGEVFFSMELVKGEDLAKLLRRVGRLPVEKVIDIARQLCAGLAAAHARGVLHRDLKPANVLIDDEGQVRITDFGIAIPRDKTGNQSLIGTPGYMAPEQLVAGAALTERTDIYALGVVMYELLAGVHPFAQARSTAAPVPLLDLVPVDPALDRLVLRALSVNPDDRPSSAMAVADALVDMVSARPTGPSGAIHPVPETNRSRRWLAIGSFAAVTISVAALAWFWLSARGSSLSEKDTIMLADFENTTGEAVFDGTLKVALAVALEQSPFLKVFPDQRARDTLRLMDRPPNERLSAAVALEIARREQLKALLTGSIASLGSHYVVAIEAVNAATGDVMAREQVEVSSKEQVLTGLGTAASKLREKLGESLATIERFDVQLPRATTHSLEALHAYALALDQGRAIPRLDAIPHLRRAIELDPDFAMAQALLSLMYTNTGQTALAPEYARRAFELRDRVSERERFFIAWRYYRDALQDADKALEVARSWTATYPREAFAFNALGIASQALAQFDAAAQALRAAIRLDPKFVPAYLNLSELLRIQNRFVEARGVIAEAAAQGIDRMSLHRTAYLVSLVEADRAASARHLEWAMNAPDPVPALDWEPRTDALMGRVTDAHHRLGSIVQIAQQKGFNEWAAKFALEDAEMHAVLGDCREVPGEIATSLQLSRDNFNLARAARVMALCGRTTEVANLTSEAEKRFPEATLTKRVLLPVAASASALRQGDAARALSLLEAVGPFDHAAVGEFWPKYLRGQAYLLLKDGREAAAEFQRILEHRGEAPDSMLYPLAHLGLARAAAMADDRPRARQAYGAFLEFWKDADPDLLFLKSARHELERLQ